MGKNVVCNPEMTIMYAAIDGLFTLTGGETINVFPIYEVNGDVDYHTGNIDFVGTVVIRGNVLTGFRIRAVRRYPNCGWSRGRGAGVRWLH